MQSKNDEKICALIIFREIPKLDPNLLLLEQNRAKPILKLRNKV